MTHADQKDIYTEYKVCLNTKQFHSNSILNRN